MVVAVPFHLGREVIIMDTFLEFLKEALKGITRATSAHLFQKIFLDKKKTTLRRRKQKGWFP
jgi:hypothetical protein